LECFSETKKKTDGVESRAVADESRGDRDDPKSDAAHRQNNVSKSFDTQRSWNISKKVDCIEQTGSDVENAGNSGIAEICAVKEGENLY